MNLTLTSVRPAAPAHRGPDLLAMLVDALAARRRVTTPYECHLAGAADHADLKRLERAWEDQVHPRGNGLWS